MGLSVTERAERYVEKMDGAIQGSNGSVDTLKVASVLRVGFLLEENECLRILKTVHNPKCSPAWSDKELLHKIRSAAKTSTGRPGYLLDDETERKDRVARFGGAGSPEHPQLDDASFHNVATEMLALCPLDGDETVISYVASRGLLKQAAAFGLGALPLDPARQSEVLAAMLQIFEAETLALAGLLFRDKHTNEPQTDRFAFSTHALIIPWRGQDGKIQNLQRRIVREGDSKRKYVFPIHRKCRDPFGVDRMKGRGKPVYLVEGALDAMACSQLVGDEATVLGIPGIGNWEREWAGFAYECRAMIGVDDDAAGNAKVAEIARDINDAGALSVERAKPKQGDWCDQLVDLQAFELVTEATELPKDNLHVLTVRDLFAEAHTRLMDKTPIRRCTTGVASLDRRTGGLRPGYVWVFGADTSWGKSSFLIMLVDENLAEGKRTLIVSAEDPPSMYADRLLVRRAGVNAERFRDKELTPDELRKVTDVIAAAKPDPVYLDARGKNAEQIAIDVDKAIKRHGIDLVAYDYLQEIPLGARSNDRRNEIRVVAKTLREPVKLNGKAGIIFSQITVTEGKKYPDKHSIRECRDVSNAAEAILLGYESPENIIVEPKDGHDGYTVEIGDKCILVDKCKDGPKGYTTRMDWNASSACFRRIDEQRYGGIPKELEREIDSAYDGFQFDNEPNRTTTTTPVRDYVDTSDRRYP